MRVLIIEDDVSVAEGVRRGLEAEGFAVTVRTDGRSGLDTAMSERFDLVILDLLLPELNGYRVCRELRAAENWVPIVILTAKSGDLDEAEGLETGADGFLSKPFSMVVLIARVRALLRRPHRRVDWPAVADLRLDPLRRTCLRGDTPVVLTSRETEVLAFLLDHPGELLSKQAVLDAVWGARFDGDPNIVEVYMSRLRRKLDEPFGRATIETVRGQGYRLRVGESV
ncbi:MAG: response regulator transcription factor [Actinobacteria bacterium]|nr:response regulator transcription factor [Actinomycetota bacterium]